MCLRRLIKVNTHIPQPPHIAIEESSQNLVFGGELYFHILLRCKCYETKHENFQKRFVSPSFKSIFLKELKAFWFFLCMLTGGLFKYLCYFFYSPKCWKIWHIFWILTVQGDWGRAFWGYCGSRVLFRSWCLTLYSTDPWGKFDLPSTQLDQLCYNIFQLFLPLPSL